MRIQVITLFGLLFPTTPLKMVAVNFLYTALAGLIRQIYRMARHTCEQTRPPTIFYQEFRMLETRITFVKFSLFFAGLSFLFNLLSVESRILSAYSMSAMLFIATLAGLPVAILLFLSETSHATEALLLHIADNRQSGLENQNLCLFMLLSRHACA